MHYLSIRYSARLADNNIVASVGSKGDSYDDVEFATMTYVDWFNHQRLHGEITTDASHTTPAEFEATYYRHNQPAIAAVTQ